MIPKSCYPSLLYEYINNRLVTYTFKENDGSVVVEKDKSKSLVETQKITVYIVTTFQSIEDGVCCS